MYGLRIYYEWPQGAELAVTTSNCADINVKPNSSESVRACFSALGRGWLVVQRLPIYCCRHLGAGSHRRQKLHVLLRVIQEHQ